MAEALALPDERELYRPGVGEFVGDAVDKTIKGIKKAVPIMARQAFFGFLQKYRTINFLTDFWYFGYDSGPIKTWVDDALNDNIEILVNGRDEILGYRVYSTNPETDRYSRPVESIDDFEWTEGGIIRMRSENFAGDYKGGRLVSNLEFDETFVISGAANRLTDNDFGKLKGTELDVRDKLIEYQLAYLLYERPDLRKPLGNIPGTEGIAAYSIELPKAKKTFYDSNAFDSGMFFHLLKSWGSYLVYNRTVYKIAEKFANWVNEQGRKIPGVGEDVFPLTYIQETQNQVSFTPPKLPKFYIVYR
jgi:hypothetical protein